MDASLNLAGGIPFVFESSMNGLSRNIPTAKSIKAVLLIYRIFQTFFTVLLFA